MGSYNPQKIEPKWQKFWEKNGQLCEVEEKSQKPKFYCLSMFPYPSGEGLHVGHVESYTATDIYARTKRMQGFNVLYPMGWDAFGLPAENYAIKIKTHPADSTKKSIAKFKNQIKSLGLSYDWTREINSSDEEYYKWTQWFFLLLYKRGLAYKKKAKVNWCPHCQTTLANEQVVNGRCERCETEVFQKKLDQWFFRITNYADRLLEDLKMVDWPENLKEIQRNWIGRSQGMEIVFDLKKIRRNDEQFLDSAKFNNLEIALTLKKYPTVAKIKVFTTRPDTLSGSTFMVLAPDGMATKKLEKYISNKSQLRAYQLSSAKKNELQRTEFNRDKSGIALQGLVAVNPINGKPISLWAADYVMGDYGSGAIMAVPAHDNRDFEFAFRHNLPIERVIYQEEKALAFLNLSFVQNPKETIAGLAKKFTLYSLLLDDKGFKFELFNSSSEVPYGLIVEMKKEKEVTDYIKIAQTQLKKNFWSEIVGGKYWQFVFAEEILKDNSEEDLAKIRKKLKRALKALKRRKSFDPRFALLEKAVKGKFFFSDYVGWTIPAGLFRDYVCYAGKEGRLFNSAFLDGMSVEKGWQSMADWLTEKNLGRRVKNYHLRDWLVSRQRYWGAPIPMIYCEKCGLVPVPEKDLPVRLPAKVDFVPTGESPLKSSKAFYQTTCPKCGGMAERETDTMDTFVCSSWYFFRYCDPKNEREFASQEKIRRLMPVNLYIGGVEHAVLHLLYSRFFTKVLQEAGYVDFPEPFLKVRNQGMILGPDHNKMSKSKGNVINPDEIVEKMGADTLRIYEMFMGPLEEMKPWDTKGISGARRFLEKVWQLQEKIGSNLAKPEDSETKEASSIDLKAKKLLHRTIQKVSRDIESLSFNTAISQMMILINTWKNLSKIPLDDLELFLKILAPFAPHLVEEIWQNLGHKKSVFEEEWPQPIAELLKNEESVVTIQINGKKRGTIILPAEISENEVRETVLNLPPLKKFLEGKLIRRWVYVPRKIINLVVN